MQLMVSHFAAKGFTQPTTLDKPHQNSQNSAQLQARRLNEAHCSFRQTIERKVPNDAGHISELKPTGATLVHR